MNKTLFLGNLSCLAISTAVIIRSISLGVGSISTPGPGFLPFYTGVVLALLSGVSIVKILYRKEPPEFVWANSRPKKVLIFLAVLILYTTLLPLFGFRICTFLMLLYCFRALHPYKLNYVVFLSLISTIGTWALFVLLLETQLPIGRWGI
jgi:putative tricarboxylic transport membrane protein